MSSAWGCSMELEAGPEGARRALGRLVEAVLASRGEANAVFDILAVLQVGALRVWRGSRPGPGFGGLERGPPWARTRWG